MTQSYADFATQMALVMNRKQLSRNDFEEAEKLVSRLVLAGLQVQPT
jgi:TetR/AcrR family transcriptional regulator